MNILFTPSISPSHSAKHTYKNSLSLPAVSMNTLVPPIFLLPYTIGIPPTALCLLINIPCCITSNEPGVSYSGISNDIPNIPKKPFAMLPTKSITPPTISPTKSTAP